MLTATQQCKLRLRFIFCCTHVRFFFILNLFLYIYIYFFNNVYIVSVYFCRSISNLIFLHMIFIIKIRTEVMKHTYIACMYRIQSVKLSNYKVDKLILPSATFRLFQHKEYFLGFLAPRIILERHSRGISGHVPIAARPILPLYEFWHFACSIGDADFCNSLLLLKSETLSFLSNISPRNISLLKEYETHLI